MVVAAAKTANVKTNQARILAEEITESVLDASDLDNTDGPSVTFHALEVILGNDDGLEAQLLGLGNSLFAASDLTDFAR